MTPSMNRIGEFFHMVPHPFDCGVRTGRWKALASAAAVSEETMTAYVKSLFVRGLLHTPKLADFSASRNAAKEDEKGAETGFVQIRKAAA